MALQAAIVTALKWENGQTINVEFMDGTPHQHDYVQKVVTENYGPDLIGLKWLWNSKGGGDIRITFNAMDGAWSYIGDPKKTPGIMRSQATMNLGWLDDDHNTDPSTVKSGCCGGVVLHEFGHVLGLIHEHARPDYPVQWNWPVVIADLSGPPNYWTEQQAKQQMEISYSTSQINGTVFDPNSIMIYAFPEDWVLPASQGTYHFPQDSIQHLSDLDKQLLSQMYPPAGNSYTKPSEPNNIVETKYYDKVGNLVQLPITSVTAVTNSVTGEVISEITRNVTENTCKKLSTIEIFAIIASCVVILLALGILLYETRLKS
jgi:hypothetical protein